MKNIKKVLLGYLFAALFVVGTAVVGANLVGCGSNCEGKPETTSGCAGCPKNTTTGNCTGDPS